MSERASGILLHITSLPSKYGVGDFGPSSYEFIEFLEASRQKYWQVLPLNPTEATYGNSPYSCPSSFAGNPLMISLELMKEDGYLSDSDIQDVPDFSSERADFSKASEYKTNLLRNAFEYNLNGIAQYSTFQKFCSDNKYWLDDYALYKSILELKHSPVSAPASPKYIKVLPLYL